MVCPVSLLCRGGRCDVPLRAFWELRGGYLYYAVLLRPVRDMNSLVYRKAGDPAKLMVAVRAQGADPIRRKRRVSRRFFVYGFEKFKASHSISVLLFFVLRI